MRFYNIDVKGKFLLPRGSTLPAGTGAGDKGRAFYKTDEDKLYLNDGGSWSGISGEYSDVPLSTILLIESDTVISGYTLLTSQDDGVIYYTKGSAAGGQTGGSLRGTWSQTGHVHATSGHTLTISEIPSHTHSQICDGRGGPFNIYGAYSAAPASYMYAPYNTGSTGGGASHSHGNTATSSEPNTWRPRGISYTRQQRV